jgi:serine/threonine protein kinase
MPNRYKVGELLGRGGMGQVHSAHNRSGRLVAIKKVRNTLSDDKFLIARLADEARLLRSVSHPNVVRALDDGKDEEGMPYLVMDRASGTPLDAVIRRAGPLSLERTMVIAWQFLAGLAAIHDAQIIHADVKSSNILVDDLDRVTIIDFGLARALTGSATSNGLVAGTPAYMAPEVIGGAPPTIASDIYAAATVIYEMLTGTTPFRGQFAMVLTRQLAESAEAPSQRAPERGIPAEVDRVLLQALDRTPGNRYADVLAFTKALEEATEPLVKIEHHEVSDTEQQTLRRVITPGLTTDQVKSTVRRVDNADIVIGASLARAYILINDNDILLAIEELETALRSLAPDIEAEAPITASVWRIETVLAALYANLGKHERARRIALVAYRHALQSNCDSAKTQARLLVDKFVQRRPMKMPRGSTRMVKVVERERRPSLDVVRRTALARRR